MMRLANHGLVRVAGLPVEALANLAAPRTLAAVQELEALEADLAQWKEPLCAGLYRLIGGLNHRRSRRALLHVKRAVHNGRRPEPADWAAALERAGDSDLAQQLRRWYGTLLRHEALLAAAAEQVRQDVAAVRQRLRAAWAHPSFQTGILFSQPLLYRRLVHYLRAEAEGELQRRERQLERTALAYYYRMATKTSPFSTFTLTGVGRLAPPAPGPGPSPSSDSLPNPPPDPAPSPSSHPPPHPSPWPAAFPNLGVRQSHFALNAAVVERLAARVVTRESLRSGLPLRCSETLAVGADQVRVLRSRMADSGGVRVLGIEESLISVRRSPLLDAVLALVERRLGLTGEALVDRLHRQAGGAIPRERIAAYLERLLAAGVLRVALDYDANDPQALGALGRLVGGEWADACAGVVARIAAMDGQSPAEQHETLQGVRREVQQLFAAAGGPPVGLGDQGLVHHDCLLPGGVALPAAIREALTPDLSRLSRLMPLFNPGHLLQQQVRSFFLEHYGPTGRCTELTDFYYRFCAARPDALTGGSDAWNPDHSHQAPGAAARTALVDALLARAAAPGTREAELTAAEAERFGAAADRLRPAAVPLSVGYFGHLLDEGTAFVLNQVVCGYGTYLARFGGDAAAASARGFLTRSLRAELAALVPGAEVVELAGVFGFNGQMHPPLTPRRLVYPGEPTGPERPTEAAAAAHAAGAPEAAGTAGEPEVVGTAGVAGRPIPWSEVAVAFDPGLDQPVLVSKRSGRRLVPVHLGPLSPHLLPPFFRFLSAFGPGLVPDFALLDMFEHRRGGLEPAAVRHYARLRLGRVVLLRESWCIPPQAALDPVPGESDFAYFRRLRRWARELGLPQRFFVVPVRLAEYLRAGRPANNMRRLYKPFYVHLDDFFSCQLFRRFTEGLKGATLTITEMLPRPDQLHVRQGEGHHVSEVLLELYGSRG